MSDKSIQHQAKRAFFTFVIPTTVKRMAVYALTWFAFWPAAGAMMFPRAEAVLHESGLRTAIVEELAPDRTVYVRPDNLIGRTHAALMGGPVAAPFVLPTLLREGVEGATTRDLFRMATGVCGVTVKSSNPVTLLHEIRHCSKGNEKLLHYGLFSNVLAEGDADYHAAATLATEANDPGIKTMVLEDQAKLGGGAHDTALYLDAKFNGRAVPPLKDMQQANRAAAVTYVPLMHKEFVRSLGDWACKVEENAADCTYDLAKQNLPPLALQRARLFETAWKKSFAAALKAQQQKPGA